VDFVKKLKKNENIEENRIMFTCCNVPNRHFDRGWNIKYLRTPK
jgi:hypothetical protein